MQYVRFPKLGLKVSRFGMGCMRLPKITDSEGNTSIYKKEAINMIRYAAENGVNYFDTAHAYVGSEKVLGKALSGGLREKVIIATKSPVWDIKEEKDFDRILEEELKRLKTDYIDFYLFHSLGKKSWEKVKMLGLLKKLDKVKKEGVIKYAAFSFHDDLKLFKKIIDSYPWDMCQIQLNFLQEDFQAGVEGLKYVASKGIGVVIMEPLQGGLLGENVPQDIIDKWDSSGIKRTPAEWAFRWIGNFPEATVILSGVSTMGQLKEDIDIFEKAVPGSLTDKELRVYEKIRAVYKDKLKVPCTGCAYCMPCPSGVSIPSVFRFYNNTFLGDDAERWKNSYKSWLCKSENDASQCSECGQCEDACPQHIEIIGKLKEAHKHLVADFFGVLGMNFFEGIVKKDKFIFDGIFLELPQYLDKDTIGDLDNKKALLGIRPEDMVFDKNPAADSIKATVQLVQTFPPKANMVCALNEKTINVVSFIKNIKGIKPGDSIYLKIKGLKTHLFDPVDGKAIR